MNKIKKRWSIAIGTVIAAPFVLFFLLMVLLYVPPIQNFIKEKATAYASEKTGMQISIGRLDLRFPLNLLISKVKVIKQKDTLFVMSSLNLRVQALPLFKGQIEVDGIQADQLAVNTAHLIKGMYIKGVLGRLHLKSHGIDLKNQIAVVNQADLTDTHLHLALTDTTKKDTTHTVVKWRIMLGQMVMHNVSFSMQLPYNPMRLRTHIGSAAAQGLAVDLMRKTYGVTRLDMSNSSFAYDKKPGRARKGFDMEHLAFQRFSAGIDSAHYSASSYGAIIRKLAVSERSGFVLTSLRGKISADSISMHLPALHLRTPFSELHTALQASFRKPGSFDISWMKAGLNARVGKQDILVFGNSMPSSLKQAYPFRPLLIQLGVSGNMNEIRIARCNLNLPGAFQLNTQGWARNFTNVKKLEGNIRLKMQTQRLNFLTAMQGVKPSSSFSIPDNISMEATASAKRGKYDCNLSLRQGIGSVAMIGSFNSYTMAYHADAKIHKMQLHQFLPKDSIYETSITMLLNGHGIDVKSPRTQANLHLVVDSLHYGHHRVAGINLKAELNNGLAKAELVSDNMLLKMQGNGSYFLNRKYHDGTINANVEMIDIGQLFGMDLAGHRKLALQIEGGVDKSHTSAHLASGDLTFDLEANCGVQALLNHSQSVTKIFKQQLKEKTLNYTAIRKALPMLNLSFSSGEENPLSWYLASKNITYHDATICLSNQTTDGINGQADIHRLGVDTLQLDTIFFTIKQDTGSIKLNGGVINGPKNPTLSFKGTLSGEIRERDAEMTVACVNSKGETSLLLGVKAQPMENDEGIAFNLLPEEPIIAFHKFHFLDNKNWIYLHRNMRVYANVDMADVATRGVGIRLQSVASDTTSLQNIDVELHRIQLKEVFGMFPYLPQAEGELSADLHYVQTAKSMEISTEASVDSLVYMHQPIGNVSLGASWLPGENGKQYVTSHISHDGMEVMLADGSLTPTASGKDSIAVNSTLENFPMSLVNAFIPGSYVAFSGNVNGDLHITGKGNKPVLNGQLMMDSVSLFSRQSGVRFTFDDRPVQITNSRVLFDKFALYTTSKNPFTIDGYVDFLSLDKPLANLSMKAKEYTLIDAKRNRESILYGKVLVDVDATLRGPLQSMQMRGKMNLKSTTDVTYVLTDSPLSVEDRLGDLVTFTSFKDTVNKKIDAQPTVALGGMDVAMSIHIDQDVQLKADLSPDRSSRVQLEGGGNLQFRYTPQGDMSLTGRYTLTDGMMKYALPVLPLKEFNITNGSYVEWSGDLMNPTLNFKAVERVRATVGSETQGNSRVVAFDISVDAKNRMKDLSLLFDVDAPEDVEIKNQLATMGAQERNKQAVALLATGIYLGDGNTAGGLDMGAALNSVISKQINSLAGGIKNGNISVGIDSHDDNTTGGKRTDYSFRYSQRLFNNRVQIVLGGKVSTGANNANQTQSFIDNISLEYRLDNTATRYIRLFYDKNYESILEGEITEAGAGIVLRKKMDKLGELFIFKKKKE